MRITMKNAKAAKIGIGIFISVLGIILLMFSFALSRDEAGFAERAQEITATVILTDTEIKKIRDRETMVYNVYVSYNVDGNTYEGRIEGGTSFMEKGQQLTVYYDPDSPTDVRSDKSTAGGSSLTVFALILTVAGLCLVISYFVGMAKRRKE